MPVKRQKPTAHILYGKEALNIVAWKNETVYKNVGGRTVSYFRRGCLSSSWCGAYTKDNLLALILLRGQQAGRSCKTGEEEGGSLAPVAQQVLGLVQILAGELVCKHTPCQFVAVVGCRKIC